MIHQNNENRSIVPDKCDSRLLNVQRRDPHKLSKGFLDLIKKSLASESQK
jgi:hypothetical protein